MATDFFGWFVLDAVMLPTVDGLIGMIIFLEVRRSRRIAANMPVEGDNITARPGFQLLSPQADRPPAKQDDPSTK